MNANPYAAPSLSNVMDTTNSTGLYRDRNSLVFDTSSHRFASVCLKTGMETTDTYEFQDKVLTKGMTVLACVLGGAMGYAIAKKNWGTPVALKLPLDRQWMNQATQEANTPWKWVYIGLGMLFVGILLAVFHPVFVLLCLAGFIMSIGTLIFAYLKGQKKDAPFIVSKLNGTWIWLDGINRNLLESLPELPRDR